MKKTILNKCILALVASQMFYVHAENTGSGSVEDGAKKLTTVNSIDEFTKAKIDLQVSQNNIGASVKSAIEYASKISKEDVANRDYLILLDNVATKYNQDQLQNLGNFNQLLITYLSSESALYKQAADLQEARNSLDSKYESRGDVLEKVNANEAEIVKVVAYIQGLEKTIGAMSTAISSLNSKLALASSNPEKGESKLSREIDDALGATAFGDPNIDFKFTLVGISMSQGRLNATFFDGKKVTQRFTEGEVIDGWKLSELNKQAAILTDIDGNAITLNVIQ